MCSRGKHRAIVANTFAEWSTFLIHSRWIPHTCWTCPVQALRHMHGLPSGVLINIIIDDAKHQNNKKSKSETDWTQTSLHPAQFVDGHFHIAIIVTSISTHIGDRSVARFAGRRTKHYRNGRKTNIERHLWSLECTYANRGYWHIIAILRIKHVGYITIRIVYTLAIKPSPTNKDTHKHTHQYAFDCFWIDIYININAYIYTDTNTQQ